MEHLVLLVVEDHAAVRAALGNLARFAFPGCAVLECADAASGLGSAREHRPALAIVDVSLPDMDGFDLLVQLRDELPCISVLMMSQEPPSIHAARALALGACGFVAKARLHEDLVPTLARALALCSARRAQERSNPDVPARKQAERTVALLADLAAETDRATIPVDALGACLERICRHGGWQLGHLLLLKKGERFAPGPSMWTVDDADRARYADFIAASASYEYADAGGGFASVILREKRPLWLADAAHFPAAGRLKLLRAKGIRSAFGFPVVSGGDTVALLEFFSEAVRPVDALLLERVTELAAQLARLIERERAHQALAGRGGAA